jgi:hypothetical protein
MVHEAVHQLNNEVAGLRIAPWVDEGLADYFGTSVYRNGRFHPGEVDENTYPIWWLGTLSLTGDMTQDLADGRIISLRSIVTGQGGPDIDEAFNLYYIHWWSLSHFLVHFHNGQYRESFSRVVRDGGSLRSFERNIGPVEVLQVEWYSYLCEKAEEICEGTSNKR